MTKNTENTPANVLVKTLAEMYEMVRLYQVAVSIQYDRKQSGSSEGGGSKGTVSDPTGSMAVQNHGNRSVRASVVAVDAEVQRLHDQVMRLSNMLGDAIDRWDN